MDGHEQRAEQQKQTVVGKRRSKKEEPTMTRKQKIMKELREWAVALAVAVLVVLVLQNFLFRIIRVDGQSMETTLHSGERLFVTVYDVKFSDLNRNDVVICHYPNRTTKFLGLIEYQEYFVKRCVGLPGDTVYRAQGVTHVVSADTGEDVALDERWAPIYPYGSPDDYDPYVLGEDEYFVVGDNRYNSHDSRDWNDSDPDRDVGPISKRMIVGHVRSVIWPIGSFRTVE